MENTTQRDSMINARPAYTVGLTKAECEWLEWIASRYTYATHLTAALTDELPAVDGIDAWVALSEAEAHEFREAVDAEDGHLPCMGGTLALKVEELLNRLV